MSTSYGGRYDKPLGAGPRAFGGAGHNLGIEALAGETEMVTIFDDFNSIIHSDTFGDGVGGDWGVLGWTLTDDGTPVADYIGMNDPTSQLPFDSCIRIRPGTDGDEGGQMQLDLLNNAVAVPTSAHNFQHLWLENTAQPGVTALDNTVSIFAMRVGFKPDFDSANTNFDGKAYIGWAEAGDTSILTETGVTMATPIITQNETGPLVGFCFPEDGTINGVSQRLLTGIAYVEGTNFTQLVPAGGMDATVANGAETAGDMMWWDLAVKLTVTDMSDNDDNGFTEFFYRRVPPLLGGNIQQATVGAGAVGQAANAWIRHPTVLENQTPNNDVVLVPTIEVICGPTAGNDFECALDWWAFGRGRTSR